MVRLWLDDDRDPTEPWIQRQYGAKGDEVWVKTASMAIEMLMVGNVSSISLDHDLGSMSAGTGMDVAKWIEEQAHANTLQRLEWDVHSLNPIGRINMTAAMRNADKYWTDHNF